MPLDDGGGTKATRSRRDENGNKDRRSWKHLRTVRTIPCLCSSWCLLYIPPNTITMESKKRPLVDGDDHASIKRRALAGKNGSPQSNSHDEIEDEDVITAGLEVGLAFLSPSTPFSQQCSSQLFRKEAIWRRMQEYKYDSERSHAQIQQLEFRKSTCEAGLAAMSACWAQVCCLDVWWSHADYLHSSLIRYALWSSQMTCLISMSVQKVSSIL